MTIILPPIEPMSHAFRERFVLLSRHTRGKRAVISPSGHLYGQSTENQR